MNRPLTICIVDDNPNITELLSDHFLYSGIECETVIFNNPIKAIEFLDSHAKEIDVIITDYHLGAFSGKDIVAHTPINCGLKILISGHITPTELDSFDLSKIMFFEKPLKLKQLDSAIEEHFSTALA